MNDPLIHLSPREAAALGSRSLTAFGRLFLPRTFRQNSPIFHEEIGSALYGPSRYNAFRIYRDGAKTTLLRTFTAQRISYGISRTIMFVSVSQEHSVFSTRWLRRHIQYNKKLTQTFDLKPGSKWTDEILEIKHGVLDLPITVLAAGITGQIRGFNVDDYRPDLIVCDDILNDENTATEGQRKKISSLFFAGLGNSLADPVESPHAKMCLLQTPFTREDVLAECSRDPLWNTLTFSCFDGNGESRWPERFPTAWLKLQKQAFIARGQYHLWMREMECQVVLGANKAFDVEKLRYWEVLPEGMDVILAIDPASSDASTADDQAIGAIGFHGADIYVLEYSAEKGQMPDAAANFFFQLVYRWRPHRAAVEIIAYQRILAWYLEQEMVRRRTFVAIDRVQDRRRKSDRIVQALAGPLSFGHLYVHRSHTKFIAQLDDYDPKVEGLTDDLLDMVSMGVTSMNPAMRIYEGEYEEVDDSRYPALPASVGCP